MTSATQEEAFAELERLVSKEALKEKEASQPPKPKPHFFDQEELHVDHPADAFKKGSVIKKIQKNAYNPATEDRIGEKKSKKSTSKKNETQKSAGSSASDPDDAAKEKVRVSTINKHNDYVTNRVLRNVLLERGYSCEVLDINSCSLELAEHCMKRIDATLSDGYASDLATMGIKGLANLTEMVYPEIGKKTVDDISFKEFYMATLQDEKGANRIFLEELSINIKPWLPVTGFIQRSMLAYGSAVYQYKTMKTQCGGILTAQNFARPLTPEEEEAAIEAQLRQPPAPNSSVSQAERDRINARLRQFD